MRTRKKNAAFHVADIIKRIIMEFIDLRNVYKTYRIGELDVPVLKGVSLAVRRGEMIALTGVSGSGKSTLMNILGCLDRPSAGQYFLDGLEVSTLSLEQRALLRNRKIGFVFQNFNLLPRTTALDNVTMPLAYTDLSLSESRQRGKRLLERVGLADRFEHHPSQLSGGQQQRVAIARRSSISRPCSSRTSRRGISIRAPAKKFCACSSS